MKAWFTLSKGENVLWSLIQYLMAIWWMSYSLSIWYQMCQFKDPACHNLLDYQQSLLNKFTTFIHRKPLEEIRGWRESLFDSATKFGVNKLYYICMHETHLTSLLCSWFMSYSSAEMNENEQEPSHYNLGQKIIPTQDLGQTPTLMVSFQKFKYKSILNFIVIVRVKFSFINFI